MKQTTLDEIIEKDVPEELYFKKKDWEKKEVSQDYTSNDVYGGW